MTVLLTDNLPLLAGAPNGIKKLRELILELAVRGKLVPQDPSDEPASELLNRIHAEKQRLLAESKVRKQKELAANALSEPPYGVPSGWKWQSLDSVLIVTGGVTLGRKLAGRKLVSKPYLRVANVQRGYLLLDQIKEVEIPDDEFEKYLLLKGDLLITEGGDWDKVGRTAIWRDELPECLHQNHVFRARAVSTEWEPRWAEIYLNSGTARAYFAGSSKQTTNLASINMTQLRACAFPLPPLTEQYRIIAKVDELMALCDRLEAQQADSEISHTQLVQALLDSLTQASDATDFATNWQRLAEHFHTLFTSAPSIEALKQTLLQLAVMGKLVPQDPRDEPASELLKRIAEEKERLISEEGLRTTAREDVPKTERYFTLHAGWASCRLGNLARFIDYRGRTPTKTSSGVPLITAKNVRPAFISREPQEFIADTDYLSWMTRGFPRVGDMLFTTEAPMGNVAIIDIAERFALAQRVICFQLHELGTGPFLKLAMMSSGFQAQLSDAATGMTATGIKSSRLKEIPVPIPPIAEQHRIVAKVDQLMALCDQLKTSLTQARQLNEQLASTLVERALTEDGQQAPIATDRQVARTLLAAEITHRLHSQRTFGQRKLQKVIYLAEHAAKLAAIQGAYLRDAAGPHDRQLMNQIEVELQNRQWYERTERETVGHAYRPLSQSGQHRLAYSSAWSAAERTTIERVIELMRDWDTDRCEMTVTLYAAWNDFILEGRPVSDDAIVDEVMHSWNDTKLRFGKTEWLAVLAEMKKHKILMPTGFGKRTKGGMLSLPGFE
ncbi:restriction endonuclease subunit S [Pseudomonas syringae]|uniref:restriction endonuclease subunit S n=1 Tax=Pseudomonas syringae TaxID=317 RepID=UPI0002A7B0B7|nr:restriction endonuclease subunit S [Pseudomonas syringae]ELP98967.1 restriction modification system DNA specificity domain-containing protein [Pseudomonas syringae BRIP34876]ELQ04875.1 restriction modification system DNA specificity domain-containing protein [Pseudomonas syringae BRIP34881]UZS71891.1 restriction endonuclease subunit S [Pseudomonas syringae]